MQLPDPLLPIEAQSEEVLHTLAVWTDARGEPPLGLCAVAHNVLNRAKRKHVSISATVLKPWAYSGFNLRKKHGSQRDIMLRPLEHDKESVWRACWEAARAARAGETADPTNGAVVYCLAYEWVGGKRKQLWMRPQEGVKAKWFELPEIASGRTKKLAVIGRHVFADTAI